MKVEAMTLDEALRITTRATGLAAAQDVGLAGNPHPARR
jgi:hypothetical protein